MKRRAGRWISIALHPFVLVPLAIVVAGHGQGFVATGRTLGIVGLAMLALAIYVVRRVRRGEFTDVDVSSRTHRPRVYLLATVSLAATALAIHLGGGGTTATRGAAIAATLFAGCAIVNARVKVSLHCAFAALAAAIAAGTGSLVVLVLFALAALLVAWARVAYGRHSSREAVAGLVMGSGAAVAYALWAHVPA